MSVNLQASMSLDLEFEPHLTGTLIPEAGMTSNLNHDSTGGRLTSGFNVTLNQT